MRELDIGLADRVPQLLTRELAEQADLIVTMRCGDQCLFIPGKSYVDWQLPEPHPRLLQNPLLGAIRLRRSADELRGWAACESRVRRHQRGAEHGAQLDIERVDEPQPITGCPCSNQKSCERVSGDRCDGKLVQ